MAIGGNKRELTDFTKYVGFFEGKVVAVNPTKEELGKLLGTDIEKDIEYTSEDGDGNSRLKLNFKVQDVKSGKIFTVAFLLTDKTRVNKDGTKTQYINVTGGSAWTDNNEDNLPEWFTKYDHRPAKSGEDDLYNFMRTWAGGCDWNTNEEYFNWKKLMRGNVDEIKEFIDSDRVNTILCNAIISTQEKDGEVKEYQQVYNKFFTYGNVIKTVRLAKPNTPEYLQAAKDQFKKDRKKLNSLQRFVLNIEDEEFGCKDFYVLEELKEYNSEDNVVSNSSNKSKLKTGMDY